jgi:hypothetical protein
MVTPGLPGTAPGYDHAVPLGRNTFRAGALIKLALVGFSLGYPKNVLALSGQEKTKAVNHLQVVFICVLNLTGCIRKFRAQRMLKFPFHDPLFASRSKIIE